MNDFTLDELGALHVIIGNAIESAEELGAPASILNTLHSVATKLEERIDEECKIFNAFQQLATQLEDVELASRIIAKNPDAVTTDYN
jgi:hypothetical protein